ncbi:uncharacterized protein LOC125224753 [Leguminivora glycinivorella]|uniref:uncharacterized protein LOC125224753 n=1 Tax=Leguminivora glycinivorella TaxID=1035111 RepID=UPI00200C3FFA|nr:uncharacterized protein LOC125224753 [Leguminivora glycinivorella]
MWKYNLFVVLTFLCANTISFEIFDEAGLEPEIGEENEKGIDFVPEIFDAAVNGTEDGVEDFILPDSNNTGIPDELESTKCIGNGVLDFIQCVVTSKIERFRSAPSEVAFPDIHPGVFQRRKMNKIQGSLEKWIKEFIKDMVPDTNCTSDE